MTRWKDGTPATLEVATMRMHQGRPVVGFRGYASINDAEPLAGLELRVEEVETEALPAGWKRMEERHATRAWQLLQTHLALFKVTLRCCCIATLTLFW